MTKADIPQDAVRTCIKTYLHVNGLSYKDLADKSGYTLSYIGNSMSNFDITTRSLKRFAEALDYPYDMLLRGEQYYGKKGKLEELEERVAKLEETVRFLMER